MFQAIPLCVLAIGIQRWYKMLPVVRQIISSSLLRSVSSIGFFWNTNCACSTKTTTIKAPKASGQWQVKAQKQGQPTHATHPHLMQEGELLPGVRLDEFQERRFRLMEGIHKHASKHDNNLKQHLVVIPSATKVYMTQKIPYVFRQNTDFLYLSGCLEPDSALVLTGMRGDDHLSTLFVRERDTHSELWDGPRTGVEGAPALFGLDQAYALTDLESFIASFMRSHRNFILWYDFMNPAQPDVHRILREFLGDTWNKMWESPKPFIHRLRLHKSTAEVALMKASCKIASDAINATIASSYPGITEHQLFARVDYECRMTGAEYLAYPPVVAGGDRANIIHYINNNQVVSEGEMVLMDAGCEYHGYSSDITRTWPVDGRFSQPQRDLYEAVLSVQTELIRMCATLPSLDNLFHAMCTLLGQHLQELGVLSSRATEEELSRAAYSFCPHHVSHYLGMDVHDTALIPRSVPLEPGMVITIEPGKFIAV
ncbi:probable Xaa-Pro aminopeptidase 3 isoform X2 [Zootermopsis nevadensis]|uniref:probable Xaa-Pro aminopeptidase 3 isoform X2 n=1 Tax=Zootermopsis nevadensis TaxID=136037 RepID=UPI000B8EDF92|nr:probable Xaa-Pro aminopeptidase 3 isoform X2 [Zootermopsis nevadensis]